MRFRGTPRAVLAGAILVTFLHAGSLMAAGPPSVLLDARRTWQGDRSTFRFVGLRKWVETTPTGQITYRENNRKRDYIELHDRANRRFVRLYAAGVYVYVPEKEHFRWVCAGGWDDRKRKPLDLSRNASDRRHLKTADQQRSFPRLGDNYEVMAPATVTYNCIGWSIGNSRSWVWPRSAGQPVTLSDFDALYRYYGFYRIAGLDFTKQPGLEKVVLFALRKEDGATDPTHAARQLADGSWSSKLGSLPLIRHIKPEDVGGPTYGEPYAVYVRPVKQGMK